MNGWMVPPVPETENKGEDIGRVGGEERMEAK